MKWLDSITDSMDMSFEQTPGDSEGQRSLACGRKERDMTWQLSNSHTCKKKAIKKSKSPFKILH